MSGGSSKAEAAALPLGRDDLAGLAEQVVSRGGCFRFRAPGSSMHPLVRSGDEVVICPLEGSPRPGHVLLTRQPSGAVVLHRLIRRQGPPGLEIFTTMGDGSRTADPPVGREQIIGVLRSAARNGRTARLDGPVQSAGGRGLALLGSLRCRWPQARGARLWLRRLVTVLRLAMLRLLWLHLLAGSGRFRGAE